LADVAAKAKAFSNAAVEWAKRCKDLQDRMAKQRDAYFQLGAHLDEIAAQNKGLAKQQKDVAAGPGKEKFATMMAVVAAIREAITLGHGAAGTFDDPNKLRGWINAISKNRTKKPKRSFMTQFAMPEGEASQLQALYDEVSTFHGWVGLVDKLYGPIETKA